MDYIKTIIAGAVGGLLILIGGMFGSASFGGYDATTFENPLRFNSTLNASSTLQVTGATSLFSTLAVTATTTASRNIVVTDSNTATSSIQVGCLQTHATSTDTPIRLIYGTIATTSGSHEGGNSVAHVLWAYGKCPRI